MSERPVLIVDDDDDIREVLAELIALAGFPALQARHGGEALSVLERAGDVSVVFLDLMMPVMNGFELLAKLHAEPRRPTPPIVVITGMARGAEELVGLDVAGVLQKPLKIESVLAWVRRFSS